MKSNRILMLAVALSVSMAAAFATEDTLVSTPMWFENSTQLDSELNNICAGSLECQANVAKFADKVGRIYVVQDICEVKQTSDSPTCKQASDVVELIVSKY